MPFSGTPVRLTPVYGITPHFGSASRRENHENFGTYPPQCCCFLSSRILLAFGILLVTHKRS